MVFKPTRLLYFIFLFLIVLIASVFLINNLGGGFTLITTANPYKSLIWGINILFLLTLLIIFQIGKILINFKKGYLGQLIFIFFLLFDLFLSTKTVLLTAPIDSIQAKEIIHLTTSDQLKTKIYTVPPKQIVNQPLFSPSVEREFAREKKELLLPNQNINEKIHSLDGYASMSLNKYLNKFTEADTTITGLGKLDLQKIDFNLAGVSHILTKEKVDYFDNNSRFKLIKNDYPFVYQVKNTRELFFLEK